MDAQTAHPDGRSQLAEYIRGQGTQAGFARLVKCSESHLSLILSGERGCSFALAKRISSATGIPVEALPHEKAEAAE